MASTPARPKSEPGKLRDSCNSCAVSKIKCDKEKPVCGRCSKRGRRCEYFATRRAGRKHESRQRESRTNDNNTSSNSSLGDKQSSSQAFPVVTTETDSTSVFISTWDVRMSEDITFRAGSGASPSNALYANASPVLQEDNTALWKMTPSTMSDVNDLFAAPMSFPMLDMSGERPFEGAVGERSKSAPNDDGHGEFNFDTFSSLLAAGTHLVMDNTSRSREDQFQFSSAPWDQPASPTFSSSLSSPPSSIVSSSIATTKRASTADIIPDRLGSEALDPTAQSGCCLIQALELLKRLFPGSATCTCTQGPTFTDSSRGGATHHIPTIQRVIAENKHTLEAIQAMLQCPCAEGDSSYLLAVISLVVFKVLAWYKAVLHDSPTTTSDVRGACNDPCHGEHVLQTPAVIDGYRLDGDDQARMAGQLVLSELHRVQRLINVLANRLQLSFGSPAPSTADSLLFSPAWFGQLETDLRKRVRFLSLEIVELLRR